MEENIKMSADEMLMNEEALLRGLMDVASDKDEEIKTIEVIRKGQLKFAFRIRPLTEKEYQEWYDNVPKKFRWASLNIIWRSLYRFNFFWIPVIIFSFLAINYKKGSQC